jgi:hypothetical protein
MLQSARTDAEPYEFRATTEEMRASIDIVKAFAKSLQEVAEPQPNIEQFYVGCGAEEVIWSSSPIDPFVEGNPPLIAFSDFTSLGGGNFSSLTPANIHALVFTGPHSVAAKTALVAATLWERDRHFNGEVDDVHLRAIQAQLLEYTAAVQGNLDAALS